MNIVPILADFAVNMGGGGGVAKTLILLLIMGVVFLLIWWVGNWIFGQLGAPPIVSKAWMILFVLLGLIWAVNLLLSLVGHGFITF
jgi:hypothetical protein